MGLGASGKSSIKSVAFEGFNPEEVVDYNATINYTRSTKNIIDSSIQIFDCGGQENFISAFMGEKAEFIFTDVSIFIWVVDMSDFDQVSTSKFYFDHGIKRMLEFSPNGSVYCLFHKKDLIVPKQQDEVFKTMKQYFKTDGSIEIQYRVTSIFDRSIYNTVGEIIQTLIIKSTKALTVSEAIQDFLDQQEDLMNIIVCNEEGVPLFEEGNSSKSILFSGDLSLVVYNQMKTEFIPLDAFKLTMELDNYIFVFKKLKKELLFIGSAEKVGPSQFSIVKLDKIADNINELV
jgi:hypothetical protein